MNDDALVNERIDKLLAEHEPGHTVEFLGRHVRPRLANVSFPEGFGGLGVAPGLQRTVDGTRRRRRRPRARGSASASAWPRRPSPSTAPTTSEPKWLRPLFTGEEVWCQLFSEPGRRLRRREPLDHRASATATSGS